MTAGALSPELCGRIVFWARLRDLPALCRTCKAFQRDAEARLWESLVLTDPATAHLACRSLVAHERLGALVRSFVLYQAHPERAYARLPPQFWAAVQGALARMRNLEVLHITDPARENTWILDPGPLHFQLRDARLSLAWDALMVGFLEGQRRLRSLQTGDAEDAEPCSVPTGALAELQVYDGPLLVAAELLHCPLKNLQMHVDAESAAKVLSVLPRLTGVSKTLRALSVVDMPEELTVDAMHDISTACPGLLHVGILHLPSPWLSRHELHASLMRMHYLEVLEIDVAHWQPRVTAGALRALVYELHIYCRTLRTVVTWIGAYRVSWRRVTDGWSARNENLTYPTLFQMA